MRTLRNSSGFTLIELMIVVVIIGILAAIAIPRFTQVSNQAKQAEAPPILKQMCSLAEAERLKTSNWPANEGAIPGWEDPQAEYFTFAFASGTATASLKTGVTGMQTASMNCVTKDLSVPAGGGGS